MGFLNSPITSEKFEEKAQRLYKYGKWAMFIGAIGLALALLIGLISCSIGGYFYAPFIFMLRGYEFAYPIVIIDYLALLIGLSGPSLYFTGMCMFGLARIAHNTEKE